ncbi:MAG: hypothetical protein GY708_15675 [Actinomycetia bacterium]|nr:hypothetical protein [Actinomycetes bacterium]MCP4960702.1 hypothetical protein [Actinomycetes bacterium]
MTAETTVKRHPIRGAIYGVVLGIGLALVAVGRKMITLDSIMPIVLIVVGIAVGVLWAMFAPAKQPKNPAVSRPEELTAD